MGEALSISTVELTDLRQTLRRTSSGKIIGRHPSIRDVVATIERVAPSTCNVLITGESGTGKELVVAALHDASPRAGRPLIPVNCGAIPETLIESLLFGHQKGAFTGALEQRGFVAAAEGGTLFLDEVGELPLGMQVKILRLLQQKEYTPVGAPKSMKCDIRVVAATNRDLDAEVAAGRFREDLFYRLNVVHVHLPPLRERGEDIEILSMFFLQHFATKLGPQAPAGFTTEAMEALRSFEWPGNIRALENAVERAVLLANGPLVTLEDLPVKVRAAREHLGSPRSSLVAPRPMEHPLSSLSIPPTVEQTTTNLLLPDGGIDLRAAVEHYENNLIRQALLRTGGNKNRAAQLLQINRTTLVEMLKRKKLSLDQTGS